VGTALGTSPQNESSQPPVSDWLVDSRGGTRTHEPGIMRGGAQRGKIALPLRARNVRHGKEGNGMSTGAVLGAVLSRQSSAPKRKMRDARVSRLENRRICTIDLGTRRVEGPRSVIAAPTPCRAFAYAIVGGSRSLSPGCLGQSVRERDAGTRAQRARTRRLPTPQQDDACPLH
jgi:hypothetical protein